jgi:hypothetical protein
MRCEGAGGISSVKNTGGLPVQTDAGILGNRTSGFCGKRKKETPDPAPPRGAGEGRSGLTLDYTMQIAGVMKWQVILQPKKKPRLLHRREDGRRRHGANTIIIDLFQLSASCFLDFFWIFLENSQNSEFVGRVCRSFPRSGVSGSCIRNSLRA